jgi:trimeric autotransporter adhesin
MKKVFLICMLAINIISYAQTGVAVNTTGAAANSNAMLDVSATNKGMLVPRVDLVALTTNSLSAFGISASPVTSLLVYNTTASTLPSTIFQKGFYYWDGTNWIKLNTGATSSASTGWTLTGNSGTNPTINFIGTVDDNDVVFKRNNAPSGRINFSAANTSFGLGALNIATTGAANTAFGAYNLQTNTTGYGNTAAGTYALATNNVGFYNTAHGYNALINNTIGNNNTANGKDALFSNTTGYSNVAVGISTLQGNKKKSNLVAIGDSALYNNGVTVFIDPETSQEIIESGTNNTAIGSKALFLNDGGANNTAVGFNTMKSALLNNSTAVGANALKNGAGLNNIAVGNSTMLNATGSNNTAIGSFSLQNNTGQNNTALGNSSMLFNTTGLSNTAVGVFSLSSNLTGGSNSSLGSGAIANNTSGNLNTAIGNSAMANNTTGNSNTAMGSNTLRLNNGYSNVALGVNAMELATKTNNSVGIGDSALFRNGFGAVALEGIQNTATGSKSLMNNTKGSFNTSNGFNALMKNTLGYGNTSTGNQSLIENTTGYNNSATGALALALNTTGSNNTATGALALYGNTLGLNNTAIGSNALNNNTIGNSNTAIGVNALLNNTLGEFNSAIGNNANVGQNNLTNATAIGSKAFVNCSNCLVLGSVYGVNTATSSVNVGIGTTTPQAFLEIKGASSLAFNPTIKLVETSSYGYSRLHFTNTSAAGNSEFYIKARNTSVLADDRLSFQNSFSGVNMTITGEGKVGIGVDNPTNPLSFPAQLGKKISLYPGTTGDAGMDVWGSELRLHSDYSGADITFGYDDYTNGFTERMRIKGNGNVGIGIANPNEKLAVNGRIRSKEVFVEAAFWPDFVFDEKYSLPTLSEVEKFIAANKHLPNIPNANEVETNGQNLGDIQKKMLQKIEELTLYIIEQNKTIDAMQKRLQTLENK